MGEGLRKRTECITIQIHFHHQNQTWPPTWRRHLGRRNHFGHHAHPRSHWRKNSTTSTRNPTHQPFLLRQGSKGGILFPTMHLNHTPNLPPHIFEFALEEQRKYQDEAKSIEDCTKRLRYYTRNLPTISYLYHKFILQQTKNTSQRQIVRFLYL